MRNCYRIVAAFLFLHCAPVVALDTQPVLSLDIAKRMADACEALAEKSGWRKVNVAIYDAGGNLKLFRRQDGAYMHSIQIAQLKAHTSAGFPRPTRALGEFVNKTPGQVHGIEQVPGIVIFPGGLPILTAAGAHLGGIGVSGATSDQDELCAQAAIDAVADELK